MKRLERIQINGFKSIRDMEEELFLSPINVLIGANGSGKSNFIEIFDLLSHIADRRLDLYVAQAGGANRLLYFGKKTTAKIEITLFVEGNYYYADLIPSAGDGLKFSGEGYSVSKLDKYDHDKNYLYEVFSGGEQPDPHILNLMLNWRVYHFNDTGPSSPIKNTNKIGDSDFLRPDAANLAAFLYSLRLHKHDYYQRIVKTVRLAAPFFEDFDLQPVSANPDTILLRWRHRNSEDYFDASAFSDGTLRFICLTTLLLQPEPPSVIVIDEPELGLHPYAETLFASMVRSVAATDHQVIISTQSVKLVDEFSPEDIIVVEREDNQSVFRRQSTEKLASWLEDYSLGELWEKNVLGGRP